MYLKLRKNGEENDKYHLQNFIVFSHEVGTNIKQ